MLSRGSLGRQRRFETKYYSLSSFQSLVSFIPGAWYQWACAPKSAGIFSNMSHNYRVYSCMLQQPWQDIDDLSAIQSKEDLSAIQSAAGAIQASQQQERF
jgi:hypothetical protein